MFHGMLLLLLLFSLCTPFFAFVSSNNVLFFFHTVKKNEKKILCINAAARCWWYFRRRRLHEIYNQTHVRSVDGNICRHRIRWLIDASCRFVTLGVDINVCTIVSARTTTFFLSIRLGNAGNLSFSWCNIISVEIKLWALSVCHIITLMWCIISLNNIKWTNVVRIYASLRQTKGNIKCIEFWCTGMNQHLFDS